MAKFALLCAVSALTTTAHAEELTLSHASDKFGKFEIGDPEYGHPLSSFLDNTGVEPVIMREYFYEDGAQLTQRWGTAYFPGGASYRLLDDPLEEFLFENVSALVGVNVKRGKLTVRLTQTAEVMLILQYDNKLTPQKIKSAQLVGHLPGWSLIGGVQRKDGPLPFSYETRSNEYGVAIAKTTFDDIGYGLHEMKLPNLDEIQLNGIGKPKSYVALFVKKSADGTRQAFPYPPTPAWLNHTIEPMTKCPFELHDLWKTVAEDKYDPDNWKSGQLPEPLEGESEPDFSRANDWMIPHTTWHPAVDPVYWCTYGHEHGSFPGKFRPAFTHTAHKTTEYVVDEFNNTVSRRQVESDEGFKVFTFFESNKRDDGRVEWLHWIIVVHQELNNARRFSARHHTVHVTVFDHNFKQVMANLQLKNDFGFVGTKTQEVNKVQPLNSAMMKIKENRDAAKQGEAFRLVNLRSKTEDCTFKGKKLQTTPKNMNGRNEHWRAPLNTCSVGMSTFKLDTSNPRTGLLSCVTEGEDMELDYLEGDSMRRSFTSGNFAVAFEACDWKGDVYPGNDNAVLRFYTDPYFSKILPPIQEAVEKNVSTTNYMVQSIHPGFEALLPRGTYRSAEFWQGKYVRKGTKGVTFADGHPTFEEWIIIGSEN